MIRQLAYHLIRMLLVKRNISTRKNTINFDSNRFESGVPILRDHVPNDSVSYTEHWA